MGGRTDELIRRLAGDGEPVRTLPVAPVRALNWLVMCIAAIVLLAGGLPDPAILGDTPDRWYIGELVLGLAVGAGSALLAFRSVVPGLEGGLSLVVLPGLGWLAILARGCVLDALAPGSVSLQHDPSCLPIIILLAAGPAAAMTVMLRRGAPLTPCRTLALGGFASAVLANVALRVVYPEDPTLMLFVWHVGGILAVSVLTSVAAHRLFRWDRFRSPI